MEASRWLLQPGGLSKRIRFGLLIVILEVAPCDFDWHSASYASFESPATGEGSFEAPAVAVAARKESTGR